MIAISAFVSFNKYASDDLNLTSSNVCTFESVLISYAK